MIGPPYESAAHSVTVGYGSCASCVVSWGVPENTEKNVRMSLGNARN